MWEDVALTGQGRSRPSTVCTHIERASRKLLSSPLHRDQANPVRSDNGYLEIPCKMGNLVPNPSYKGQAQLKAQHSLHTDCTGKSYRLHREVMNPEGDVCRPRFARAPLPYRPLREVIPISQGSRDEKAMSRLETIREFVLQTREFCPSRAVWFVFSANTDSRGKEYRSQREIIPTPRGNNTDFRGKLYRLPREGILTPQGNLSKETPAKAPVFRVKPGFPVCRGFV